MNFSTELPTDLARLRVLDTRETAKFIGVSIPTLRRMYRSAAFPRPVLLHERTYGWQVGVIADWLKAKADQKAA